MGADARGPLSPGRTLDGRNGSYEVVRELGQGGFGIAYLARSVRDGAEVVVKVLHLSRAASWKAVELFEREAAVLRRLDHPNIPDYVDQLPLGDASAPLAFAVVQEFVPGRTLGAVMRSDDRLDPLAMRGWLTRVLEICAYLHQQHPPVIHRDIKPNNIVLREPDGAAVLIDFGTVQAALVSESTISSTAAGTFGYAPMEQLVGRAVPASDLYSVAVTYLAVASGLEPDKMPFSNNRIQVRETLAGTSPDARLLLLLEEMTEPDASRRPQSATEVLERLRGLGSLALVEPRAAPTGDDHGGAVAERPDFTARHHAIAARATATAAEEAWTLPPFPDHEDIRGFRVDPSGRWAFAVADFSAGKCALLDTSSFQLRHVTRGGIGRRPLISTDGCAVLSTGDGAQVHYLSPGGELRKSRLELSSDATFWMTEQHLRMALSPDRRLLAYVLTFGSEAGGYLVDLERGAILQRFDAPNRIGDPDEILFAPDNRALLIGGGYNGYLALDPSGAREQLAATAVAFSPDGRQVAVAHEKSVRVGAVETLVPLKWRQSSTVWTGQRDIDHLRFSPDGRRLAMSHGDERVVVIDVGSRRLLLEAEEPHLPNRRLGRIESLGFSADGSRLFVHGGLTPTPLAKSRDLGVAVYDVGSRRALGTLSARDDDKAKLRLVAVTPGGFACTLPPGKGDRSHPLRRSDVVLATLRGASVSDLLEPAEADTALDLEERVRFWTGIVGQERLIGGDTVGRLVEASRGLTHLLAYAVRRVGQSDGDRSPRFGERGGAGMTLPLNALLGELDTLARRSAAERQILFEDQLAALVAEDELRRAEAARSRRTEVRRQRVARFRPWIVGLGMLAVVLLFILFGLR